jgi:hypothetical protein
MPDALDQKQPGELGRYTATERAIIDEWHEWRGQLERRPVDWDA